MKLGWDRGKGRWFMSGILPIGPAKKTGSISDSEIDPVCYNGILWHDNRANSRMPPSDGACRFGLPLAPIIEKGIIYFCYAILFCIFLFVLHRFSRAIGDSWRRTAREKGGSMSSGPLGPATAKIRPEPGFDVTLRAHNCWRIAIRATKTTGKAAIGQNKIGAKNLGVGIQILA